jgi:2,3-bisphosphoglycerate-independent phosphoglycerate mutase
VDTYDQQPEMSATQVTDAFIEKVNEQVYDVIIVNYANPDMVGHTGVLSAAVKAVETVDRCIGRAVEAVQQAGGVTLITADHGNAEVMAGDAGEPFTAHTTDPVPFLLVSREHQGAKMRSGRLEDVAPTVLHLLNIEKPPEMTGHSLLD